MNEHVDDENWQRGKCEKREACKPMDGTVRLYSTHIKGKGARFTFWFQYSAEVFAWDSFLMVLFTIALGGNCS